MAGTDTTRCSPGPGTGRQSDPVRIGEILPEICATIQARRKKAGGICAPPHGRPQPSSPSASLVDRSFSYLAGFLFRKKGKNRKIPSCSFPEMPIFP